ncbi:substrate-binding domain-containing protein [Mesorhizobium caraganae]|uniref:substrate-binding domain-containing protein n=1 Tax=Mesorhizobium caraganae TaxID=483206 RepID=UPI003F50B689
MIPGRRIWTGPGHIAVALHSRPPLTTIRIDRVELGRAGIQMLMKRIADPGANIVRVNIGVRLVERPPLARCEKRPYEASVAARQTGTDQFERLST